MIINIHPKTFNVVFKAIEIPIVLKALELHRANPGTNPGMISRLDYIKRHLNPMFPATYVFDQHQLRMIQYGVDLIPLADVTEEQKEFIINFSRSLENAITQ